MFDTNFNNVNDDIAIETWIERNPVEWQQIIAVRAALRSLPFIGWNTFGGEPLGTFERRKLLYAFRASILSWGACVATEHGSKSALQKAGKAISTLTTTSAYISDDTAELQAIGSAAMGMASKNQFHFSATIKSAISKKDSKLSVNADVREFEKHTPVQRLIERKL